jgi:hypothetical protein
MELCQVSIPAYYNLLWFDSACPEYVSHFDMLCVTRTEGLTMTGCCHPEPLEG